MNIKELLDIADEAYYGLLGDLYDEKGVPNGSRGGNIAYAILHELIEGYEEHEEDDTTPRSKLRRAAGDIANIARDLSELSEKLYDAALKTDDD